MFSHKYVQNNSTGLEYFSQLRICKNPTNGVVSGIEQTYLALPKEILDIIGQYLSWIQHSDYEQDQYVTNVLGEFTTIFSDESYCNIL